MEKHAPEMYQSSYKIGQIKAILSVYELKAMKARDALERISKIIDEDTRSNP